MKTGAWLRGGRGKIAGMVAQKSSDGKGTILRELVTPSNPKTEGQMATRLAFGTVTQAAALMLPIIGQTFKGMSNETLNRRRFVSLNVPILQAEAISQQAGNTPAGYFRGKSSSALIPNPYIVSEGSLILPEQMIVSYNAENRNIQSVNMLNDYSFTFTVGGYYSPATVLSSILGLEVNQQVTLVGIFTTNGEAVDYVAKDSADYVRTAAMRAWRLNLKADAPAFQYTEGMTAEALIAAVMAGVDREKTADELYNQLAASFDVEQTQLRLDLSYVDMIDQETAGYNFVAFAIILSQLENGVWDYSRSQMVIKPSYGSNALNNNEYYGLTYNNALIDFLGSEAASKLYTRKGGLINTI